MKIGLLTALNPENRASWASWADTICHITKALEKYCGEVTYIGPISPEKKQERKGVYKRLQVFLKKFSIARKYFIYNYRLSISKKYANLATQILAESSFDVIVAPASSTEVVFVKTDIPIVLLEDATFALLHNYYPQYTNLSKKMIRMMNNLAGLAIEKASLLIYASAWAAHSAIEDYHADQSKVHAVPSGANLENPPPQELVLERQRSDRCRLLFLGVDWQRKGGEIAFETLLKLEEMGISAELIVCGCIPPKKFSHERMTIIPFLNKKDERQRKELEKLYLTCDFLLLPTRSECYGMVFCEANAFGLPVITTHTGGVPEIVRDGENGFMLPYTARGTEYAEVIARTYQDEQRYAELVKSSRAAFDERLNWDAWGRTVTKLITEMLERQKSSKDSAMSIEIVNGVSCSS
jgi:glycosyltransferase involved in cell wall biosynthesis